MPGGRLIIDLDAIAANWRALDAMSAPGTQTAAVVKADAYGLGAETVARRLAAEGARSFFVALAEEGAALRAVLGRGPAIFVLSGHMPGDTDMLGDLDLWPVLNAPEQAARHLQALPGHPFGVQLDTGMNRLGMEAADWAAWRERLLPLGPKLVMSHLACADAPDHPSNAAQLAAFREMTAGVAAPLSLAATGGTLLGPDYHFDLTRPGIGLYGGLPYAEALPVVRLELPVIQVRDVAPGETVGYGDAWRAERPSRVATLSAGYADGLIRAMGGRARVWDDATPCPVIGRVSMDLLTVDVTHLARVPDRLAILGPGQGIDDLAEMAGTIGYEILTSLGARYGRRLAGSSGPA